MKNNKKILAIIPARGGSKGIPKKNIKELRGKPLIAWTIEAAKRCSFIDKLIVSTDDNEIADISEKYGAEVPFIRPKELAVDTAKGIDVIYHALNWFEDRNEQYKLMILLQPTSPLRKTEDINHAIDLFFEKNGKAIISVCDAGHHPYWFNTIPENLSMATFIRVEVMNKNRQELPLFYRLNGAIYLSDIDYLKKNSGFYGKDTYAYIMSQETSIDIDNLIDFKLAEILLKEFME